MNRHLSPEDLAHLQAFRYWLCNSAIGWDISLPEEDEVVADGKEYPPFCLYRNGVEVAMVESPIEALEKVGSLALMEEYLSLMADDSP